jgi:integrase
LAAARHKGRECRLVYLLAVWTGLRRSEIRRLTWCDVQIDALPGKILLRAGTTRSRRADALPIHPQLAEDLRAWRPAEELLPRGGMTARTDHGAPRDRPGVTVFHNRPPVARSHDGPGGG